MGDYMRSTIVRFAMLFVFSALLAVTCFGQTYGEITGVVADPSGAIMVGANVTVTNPQTGFTRTAATNSSGNYTFPALQPGLYSVRVEMQGFQSEVRSGVELQVQQTARIDFQLRVGTAAETVEVTGGAPLLSTENASVGTVIDNQRITEMPLNGRNFIQLVSLSPNVNAGFGNNGTVTGRQGGDRTNQAVSVAGQRREYTYYTLDGISNTDVNFNTYIFLPSIDMVQEFKVQTGVYSAEFGRETNQVNVSTKGGTNQYHGALFEFLRNSKLDARPFGFTAVVPNTAPFKWNQFGFAIGGPVSIPKLFSGKDRLFFSSNFEGFRQRQQTQTVYTTIPASMRTGNFSQLLPNTLVRDFKNNNAPFPGNIIPATLLDSTALKLLAYDPSPNVPGSSLSNNYLGLANNVTDKDQFSQRIDYTENLKSSWAGRYSWQSENVLTPGLYKSGGALTTKVRQVMLSNTRLLSPTKVNEFRFGYSGFHNNNGPDLAFKEDVTTNVGLKLLSPVPAFAWGVPNIGITGYSSWGNGTDNPYDNNDHVFQWIDSLSWIRGTHSIKMGAEVRRDRFNQNGNQYIRGQFNFQNQATGYSVGDYLTGYINRFNNAGAGAAVAQLRATSQSYFIDDSWKVRPNLTISAGLRYEYVAPWDSKNDSLINVYLPSYDIAANAPADHHPVLVRVGKGDFYEGTNIRFDPAIRVARDGRLGDRRSLIAPDRNNFAPRLGLAWSPAAKWTFRLGAGYFFVQDQGNAFFEPTRNISGRLQSSANTVTHDLTFKDPIGPAGAICKTASPLVCISTPLILGADYNRPNPYVFEFLANIQRQLTQSTVLELGYIGSEGHKLSRYIYLNMAVASPIGSIASRTPYPEFAQILQTKNIVNSNYHSVSAKVTRRLSNGLTLLAGFTFAKSLDDGSGLRSPNSFLPGNNLCVKCEYGRSDFDVNRRFVASALYQLPAGKGRAFFKSGVMSQLLGGWSLGGIITASTGFPLNFGNGTDRSNTGVSGRPNATGLPLEIDNKSTAQWFNTQAFSQPDLGTWGNLGHNVGTGPGIFTTDMSTLKNFNFSEARYLQFRFEIFNAMNHPNFGDPGTTLTNNRIDPVTARPVPGTGDLGVISSTRTDMRQLQFSLKLVF